MTPDSAFWTLVDGVAVIPSGAGGDPWTRMRTRLAAAAPMEKVHRILPAKTPGTALGRLSACREALRRMRERGWKRMLLLGDDARFPGSTNPARLAGKCADRDGGPDADRPDYAAISNEAILRCAAQELAEHPGPWACLLNWIDPAPPIRKKFGFPGGAGVFDVNGDACLRAMVVNAEMAEGLLAGLPGSDWAARLWLLRHGSVDAWCASAAPRLGSVMAVSPRWGEEDPSPVPHGEDAQAHDADRPVVARQASRRERRMAVVRRYAARL